MYTPLQQNKNNRNDFSAFAQTPAVSIRDLTVQYGNLIALKSIDLDINLGEMIFLTGPSGAGKSTLLKIINNEIVPSKGVIQFNQSGALFTAPIFQDLRLLEKLSVIDNLQFVFGSVQNQSKAHFDKELQALLKIFGLSEFEKTPIKNLNGGAKQKVGIVRAILSQADMILADEPTSSLDMENTVRLFDLFSQLVFKRKITVVWATHNRELVNKFNGRVIHLDKGKLIYSGNACFI